ncbi:MAG: sigma-70 factor domain-containing protein, partial [Anaerolineae bacterium]
MDELLEQASHQGYITYDQILEVCPTPEEDREGLEGFFAQLHTRRIPVYEQVEEPADQDIATALLHAVWDDDWRVEEPEDLDAENLEEYLDEGPLSDTVTLYFREMSQYPLLSPEEEKELARAVFEGRAAAQRLASQNDSLNEEEREALRQIVQKGREARDKLIRANTRLVISVAKHYIGRGVPFSDLIQEGNLGLMRAVSKFDYRRG